MVAEVLSPSALDFDTFDKLGEYQAVATLAHILFIEPNAPETVLWSRNVDRGWEKMPIEGLDTTIALPALGIGLAMSEIYDGVAFAVSPWLVGG